MTRIAATKTTMPINTPRVPGLEKPESQTPESKSRPVHAASPFPRALVSIIPELCKGCDLCVYACPSGNLTLSSGLNSKGYHPAVFSYDGKRGPCTACGICYWVCPDMAISEIRRLKN